MTTIDEQLRHLDPARDVPEDLGQSPYALAALARVTATEPGAGAPAASLRPARHRRVVRFVMAGVVACMGVLTVVPVLGTEESAFASWDAVARAATAPEAAEHVRQCAELTRLGEDATARVVEVRGTWVMTYVTTPDSEAQCLRSTVRTAESPEGEGEASSGSLLPVPAVNGLATVGVHRTSGGISTGTQFMVSGKAGAEVAAVVFETQDTRIRATVRDGYFTAWWPQRRPDTIVGRVIDYSGFNGSPNPEVTITLTNGQTISTRIKDYDVNQ